MRATFPIATIGVAAVVGLIAATVSAAEPACADPQWEREPTSEAGHFEAWAVVRCSTGEPQKLAQLAGRFRSAIENEREQFSAPLQRKDENGPYTEWEVGHAFEQDGNSIRIREAVTLRETRDALAYEARSLEIDGSGLSSYLREVEVKTSFARSEPEFEFRARVRVKRPWFAPAFIFYPIAESKTRQQLKHQAENITRRIASRTESPLP